MKFDRKLLKTGIPLIDQQHDKYCDLVEEMFAMCAAGNVQRAALEAKMRGVHSYAIEHLDSEEFLMRAAKYPRYKAHRAKHDLFRDWLSSFSSIELADDMPTDALAIRLAKWLVEWFCDQVQVDDRQLADFLKKNNAGSLSASTAKKTK